MTQLVCDVKGSEKCVQSQKKKSFMLFCSPSSMQTVFGLRDSMCMYVWCWRSGMLEELVTTRNDPLACDGILPKNLPSFVVLCVIADNEMPLRFQIYRKPSFICAWRIGEKISIKENLLLKAFDVIKDKEYLAGALKGENLTGVQQLLAVQPCSLQFKRSKSMMIMHWGIQSIN